MPILLVPHCFGLVNHLALVNFLGLINHHLILVDFAVCQYGDRHGQVLCLAWNDLVHQACDRDGTVLTRRHDLIVSGAVVGGARTGSHADGPLGCTEGAQERQGAH